MAVPGPASTPQDPRSLEGSILLIGAGAMLLIVSLFLKWYQPGIDTWEIFEVWDLVLAVLAIAALVAVARPARLRSSAFGELAARPRRSPRS